MNEELFRFVVARPPQARPLKETARAVTEPYREGLSPTARELLGGDSEVSARANQFIASGRFIRKLGDVSASLARLDDWLLQHPRPSPGQLRTALAETARTGGDDATDDPSIEIWRDRLADSLFAVTLCSLVPLPASQHLTRGLQLVELLLRARDGDASQGDLAAALTSKVVLPTPRRRPATRPPRVSGRIRDPSDVATRRARAEELYTDLRNLRRRYESMPVQIMDEHPPVAAGELSTGSGSTAALRGRMRTAKAFAAEDLGGVSDQTLALFRSHEIGAGREMSDAIVVLEHELEDRWRELTGAPSLGSGGSGSSAAASVPVTTGKVRLTGIGDLMLVRQRVKRYELGEISHIENVLPHENFSRVFRRKDTTESFEEEETEKTESTERELQTTSKSELKVEVEKTVEEDLKFEAGLNVTYHGGMIDVAANADFSYERSTTETSKSASTFAREVVDRSVNKLQERTLKRRSLRVQREVEDTSSRGINNEESSPVVGVYRWVDKINHCEIVNYGRRELVEFVISEPAALYRHLLSNRPVTGVTAEKPEPPTYYGVALEPSHIHEYSYLHWVAQYNVTGVKPPPSYRQYVGVALEQGRRDDGQDSMSKVLETGSLKVPAGYQATQLFFDYAGEYDDDNHYWEVIVGNTEFKAGLDTRRFPILLNDNVPVSMVAKHWGSFTANIVVECTRLDWKFAEWRLETFNAIMNRYERLRSEYEEQVEAQRVQQLNGARMGTNPLTARDFERAEIKRAAIMLLTGQTFDLFGSTVETPYGPTDVQFADADAEGRYIQFVEQAFEWRHMAYAFYPYFWGRKSRWHDYALDDATDALFAQFLRAGAARVVVGIRPGFEGAVRYFLEEGKPWNGGEPPIVESTDASAPPYITIAQELSEQLGGDFVVGDGRLHMTNGRDTAAAVNTTFDSTIVDRELRIDNVDYRVEGIVDDGSLELDRPFSGASGDYRYGIGPRIVGIPWEVRLPTTLVLLDGEAERLSTIPSLP